MKAITRVMPLVMTVMTSCSLDTMEDTLEPYVKPGVFHEGDVRGFQVYEERRVSDPKQRRIVNDPDVLDYFNCGFDRTNSGDYPRGCFDLGDEIFVVQGQDTCQLVRPTLFNGVYKVSDVVLLGDDTCQDFIESVVYKGLKNPKGTDEIDLVLPGVL